MSFIEAHWSSAILGRKIETWIFHPDVGSPPFATLYLLHGLSDDHTVWQRRTRLETYVADLPLMVVMPDGLRSFYTNAESGPAYATHMAEELPGWIERTFHARPDRAGRCVGGLSMGGYGALRLALGYPDRYVSAHSHSGALMRGTQTPDTAERRLIFGEHPAGTDHDLIELARRSKRAGRLPALRLDCGTGDFLLNDNRELHREMAELGVPHEYEEFAGDHNWDYWDLHIREAVAFHARELGIQT